jgi:hypothetical protein
VGFVEIRQTNMAAFNSLIATLEQKDRYKADEIATELDEISKQRTAYEHLLSAPLSCSTAPNSTISKEQNGQSTGSRESADFNGDSMKPKSCGDKQGIL